MMDFVSARLGRLADLARAGGDDDFADGIERYLAHAHQGLSLDQALGLAVARGGETWWSREHRLLRDEINCEFYVRYCPGETDARRRATLQNSLRRYGREQWPSDKMLRIMPPAYEGTYRALLFLAFRENDLQDAKKPMPTSDDQLSRILASHCLTERNPPPGIATVEAESHCEPYNDSRTEGMQHHVGKEISITRQRRRSTGRS